MKRYRIQQIQSMAELCWEADSVKCGIEQIKSIRESFAKTPGQEVGVSLRCDVGVLSEYKGLSPESFGAIVDLIEKKEKLLLEEKKQMLKDNYEIELEN